MGSDWQILLPAEPFFRKRENKKAYWLWLAQDVERWWSSM